MYTGDANIQFDCVEKGNGYLNGSYCKEGVLNIILRMTQPR